MMENFTNLKWETFFFIFIPLRQRIACPDNFLSRAMLSKEKVNKMQRRLISEDIPILNMRWDQKLSRPIAVCRASSKWCRSTLKQRYPDVGYTLKTLKMQMILTLFQNVHVTKSTSIQRENNVDWLTLIQRSWKPRWYKTSILRCRHRSIFPTKKKRWKTSCTCQKYTLAHVDTTGR